MNQKTTLITDFVCVAVSGKTADGREISAQHLQEMAESYNPATYTANIWPEHYRWANLGQVVELKAEQAGEKTKLFARLAPSVEMIARNKAGVGLFTSIEITPQFADTGKAYLTGLAVTDTPASLGTTQICFARIGATDVLIGEPHAVQFSFQTDNEKEAQGGMMQAAAQFFKALFGTSPNNAPKIEPTLGTEVVSDNNNPKEEIFSMTKEEFAESLVLAFEKFSAKQTHQVPAHTVAPATEPEPATTVSTAEFNALKTTVEQLTATVAKYSQITTPVPNGANPVDTEHYTVNTAI